MVRAFVGRAWPPPTCLARQHGVAPAGPRPRRRRRAGRTCPAEVSAYHIGPSQPIDREDALTARVLRRRCAPGRAIAEAEIAAGADLLILGDMGIGNTTPAAALIAATFGLARRRGRRPRHRHRRRSAAHKTEVIAAALDRMGERAADPLDPAGRRWARRTWPPGSASCSPRPGTAYRCCWTASSRWPSSPSPRISIRAWSAWCAAGHRSTEPAQQLALDKLGLEPLLDLGLRLGEGTGRARRAAGAAVGGAAAARDGPAGRSRRRLAELAWRSPDCGWPSAR